MMILKCPFSQKLTYINFRGKQSIEVKYRSKNRIPRDLNLSLYIGKTNLVLLIIGKSQPVTSSSWQESADSSHGEEITGLSQPALA